MHDRRQNMRTSLMRRDIQIANAGSHIAKLEWGLRVAGMTIAQEGQGPEFRQLQTLPSYWYRTLGSRACETQGLLAQTAFGEDAAVLV